MKRFRYYFDNEIQKTHIDMHNVSSDEIEIFFNDIPIWIRDRKDGSYDAIGKLLSGRYLRVIFRKYSEFDYFIITAFDLTVSYEIDFIEKELNKI